MKLESSLKKKYYFSYLEYRVLSIESKVSTSVFVSSRLENRDASQRKSLVC